MDHDDVLEQLELAAVEPGGLERLVAGDTPMAAAVVAHLAGCEPCSEELRRLSRAAPLLRDLVRTTPPADLRERTLAFVAAHGRRRGEPSDKAPVATMEPLPVARSAPGGATASGLLRSAGATILSTVATKAGGSMKRTARAIGSRKSVNGQR